MARHRCTSSIQTIHPVQNVRYIQHATYSISSSAYCTGMIVQWQPQLEIEDTGYLLISKCTWKFWCQLTPSDSWPPPIKCCVLYTVQYTPHSAPLRFSVSLKSNFQIFPWNTEQIYFTSKLFWIFTDFEQQNDIETINESYFPTNRAYIDSPYNAIFIDRKKRKKYGLITIIEIVHLHMLVLVRWMG